MKPLVLILAVGAGCVWGYIRNPIGGTPCFRADFAGVQFLANQNIAAGMKTASGKLWITADSSPINAINGALAAWNGVAATTARFLPLQMTSLSYNVSTPNSNNVIVFVDDAFSESVTNGVLAFTAAQIATCGFFGPTCRFNGATVTEGQILNSDIFFSPSAEFSTTRAAGTFDIQAILTHELGHALGANHTNILSATMYAYSVVQDTHQQALGADDISFASALYSVSGGTGYGTLSGHTLLGAAPLLGGAIAAVDIMKGTTIGGFSSMADGSYSLQLPPGQYEVYVEPAGGLSLYFDDPSMTPPTAFQSGFAGGNAQPSVIAIQAGGQASADLSAAAGATHLSSPSTAISTAGAMGDYVSPFYPASINVSSGQSVDLLFSNPLSGTFSESNIKVIGAASIHPGTLRKDTVSLTNGVPIYRVTLDIPPSAGTSSATAVFTNGTDILTRSGLLNITRPQSVNAGSFVGGAVAPGEILSFFGSQPGPANPATNGGFSAGGLLPVSLGGVSVTFDKTSAPLFYASNNQINLQVPYEISGQTSTRMTVSYNGAPVAITTLSVAKSAPGIFVVTNADGSANGPNSPSPVGAVLVVYGTGAGITSGVLKTGAPAPANSTVAAQVTIGGTPVTPIYAGLTAGSVGLAQVNVAIPPGTPSGNAIPLQVSIAGNPTQTVNIAVQ